jgi:hypothetical protein
MKIGRFIKTNMYYIHRMGTSNRYTKPYKYVTMAMVVDNSKISTDAYACGKEIPKNHVGM